MSNPTRRTHEDGFNVLGSVHSPPTRRPPLVDRCILHSSLYSEKGGFDVLGMVHSFWSIHLPTRQPTNPPTVPYNQRRGKREHRYIAPGEHNWSLTPGPCEKSLTPNVFVGPTSPCVAPSLCFGSQGYTFSDHSRCLHGFVLFLKVTPSPITPGVDSCLGIGFFSLTLQKPEPSKAAKFLGSERSR